MRPSVCAKSDRAVTPIVGLILAVALTFVASATVAVTLTQMGGNHNPAQAPVVISDAQGDKAEAKLIDDYFADKIEVNCGASIYLSSSGDDGFVDASKCEEIKVFGVNSDGSKSLLFTKPAKKYTSQDLNTTNKISKSEDESETSTAQEQVTSDTRKSTENAGQTDQNTEYKENTRDENSHLPDNSQDKSSDSAKSDQEGCTRKNADVRISNSGRNDQQKLEQGLEQADSGDCVYINSGEYRYSGTVTIEKPVTIATSRMVVFTDKRSPAFRVTADSGTVKISNVFVKNAGYALADSGRADIHLVQFKTANDNVTKGLIASEGGGTTRLENSEIRASIDARGTDESYHITNSTIERLLSGAESGTYVLKNSQSASLKFGSGDVTIQNTEVIVKDGSVGVKVSGTSSSLVVDDSTVKQKSGTRGTAIEVMYTSDASISNSVIEQFNKGVVSDDSKPVVTVDGTEFMQTNTDCIGEISGC